MNCHMPDALRHRHGLRVEGAFDEGQQRQLGRHAAALDLLDDVEQVAAAARGHALHVVGAAGVVLLPLAHQVACRGRHAQAGTHARPQVGARGRPGVQTAAAARAAGVDGHGGADAAARAGSAGARERFRRRAGAPARRGRRRGLPGLPASVGGPPFDSARRPAGPAQISSSPQRGGGAVAGFHRVHRKRFFHSRRAANTATGVVLCGALALRRPPRPASVQRRKGLIARSAGHGGRQRGRRRRAAPAGLGVRRGGVAGLDRGGEAQVGQRVLVGAAHPRVAGSAARRASEACICAGVPSNRRPQPAENSVSPQNSSGAAAIVALRKGDVAGGVAPARR
jgi:hypothetical protein